MKRLSIFSSESPFFGVFSVALVVLLFLYYGLAKSIPADWNRIVNLRQANTIRAEELLYSEETVDVLLIGTSLTVRLNQDFLPEGYYNMGLSGGSIYSGLKIATHLESSPKLVIIETNYLLNNLDSSWISSLVNPFRFRLKKYVPVFQQKYHPFSGVAGPVMSEAGKLLLGKVDRQENTVVNKKLFEKTLTKKQRSWEKKYEVTAIQQKLKELKKYCEQLEQAGVKVLLHEMPMHTSLSESTKMKQIREHIMEFFPPHYFIPRLSSEEVTTSDGNHLSTNSAKYYVTYLTGKIQRQLVIQ